MVVYTMFLIFLFLLIVLITIGNIAYLKRVIHMLIKCLKNMIFNIVRLVSMLNSYNIKSDKISRSIKSKQAFCLKRVKQNIQILSLEKNSNKLIYAGMVFLLIGSLLANISLNAIYLTYFDIYGLLIGLLISFKESNNNDFTDYILSAFWVIASTCIAISLSITLFVIDIANLNFNFGRFFLYISLLIIILLVVIILFKNSNITLILVTLSFSIIIPILFYLYLGYGLMKYNYDDMKDLNLNIKENLSGFNAIFVMVYYGISEVVNAQSLPISIGDSSAAVNKHKEEMSMNSIYLILLGHMFNVFFFSTIFSILPTFFKKKRYNVDK